MCYIINIIMVHMKEERTYKFEVKYRYLRKINPLSFDEETTSEFHVLGTSIQHAYVKLVLHLFPRVELIEITYITILPKEY